MGPFPWLSPETLRPGAASCPCGSWPSGYLLSPTHASCAIETHRFTSQRQVECWRRWEFIGLNIAKPSSWEKTRRDCVTSVIGIGAFRCDHLNPVPFCPFVWLMVTSLWLLNPSSLSKNYVHCVCAQCYTQSTFSQPAPSQASLVRGRQVLAVPTTVALVSGPLKQTLPNTQISETTWVGF